MIGIASRLLPFQQRLNPDEILKNGLRNDVNRIVNAEASNDVKHLLYSYVQMELLCVIEFQFIIEYQSVIEANRSTSQHSIGINYQAQGG